jgi:outer membrane lipoprotein-sorting protein
VRIYSWTKAVIAMVIFIVAMVLFPAVISFTAEYPDPLLNHYGGHDSVYWKIRQITISPVFDEPETSMVELYFQKPYTLFIESQDQQIYAEGDTTWTYLIKHKQIQKTITGVLFNPFDFVDTSQGYYKVVSASDNQVTLRSDEKDIEPDSLTIDFKPDGQISRVEYLDANENRVVMDFLDESFGKGIPSDNFMADKPDDVEIVDLTE